MANNKIDTLAPTLAKNSATLKKDGITPSDNIVLTFSEKIQVGTGKITLVSDNDTRTIPISDKQVKIVGNTLTLNPAFDLNTHSVYKLSLEAGVLKDLASRPNATSAIEVSFTTTTSGDKQAPVLQQNSSQGSVGDNVQLVFQEPVILGKGNFILSDGATQISIPVNDAQQVLVKNNIVTINPSQELNPEKIYTVTSPKGIVTDVAGNAFVALTKKNAFTFDTHDKTPPTLTITDDKNDITNADILYTFTLSEASENFIGDDIVVTGGKKGAFSILSPTSYTLRVTPNADSIIPVTVAVPVGTFTDMVGNGNIASDKISQFVDTFAPTLMNTTPVNQSLNVSKSSNIILFFNENISAGKGNFIISNGNDTQTISVTDSTQVFINNKVVTINPSKELIADTQYSITFAEGGITDKAGNSFAGLAASNLVFKTMSSTATTSTKDATGQTQSFVDKLNAKALDGYLKGATVFADSNGNGVQDPDEASAITDNYGNFELDNPKGTLIVSGGVDSSKGRPFSGTLKAPEGSVVITPLTTIQQGFMDAGQTLVQAGQSVSKAFAFDSKELNLTAYDPIAEILKPEMSSEERALATQLLCCSTTIANFLVTASQVLQGASGNILSQENANDALISALIFQNLNSDHKIDQIDHIKEIDLTNVTLLKKIIMFAAKEVKNLIPIEGNLNFDAEKFMIKVEKMTDTLALILSTAANNLITAVNNNKDNDGVSLLKSFDKVSTFVQNDAGQSLQKVAENLDTKNPNVYDDILKTKIDLFTGDAATKSIENTVVDTQKYIEDMLAAQAIDNANNSSTVTNSASAIKVVGVPQDVVHH